VASLREYAFPIGSRLPSWSLLLRLSVKRAPAVSSVPHLRSPELGRAATACQPPHATQIRALSAAEPLPPRHHSPPPLIPLLTPPPVFNGVKAINAGINPDHPSPALPDPYKRVSTTPGAFHPSLSFSYLLSCAGTPPPTEFPDHHQTTAAPGLHTAARALVSRPSSSPSPTPWAAPVDTGAARGRSSGEPGATVHGRSTVDPVYENFFMKIIR
jgi:hypothetical protein